MTEIKLSFATVAEAVAFLSAGMAATGYAPGTGVLPAPGPVPQAAPVVTEKPDAQQATPKAAKQPKAVAADPTPAATPAAKPADTPPTAAVAEVAAPETKETSSEKPLDYATDVGPKVAKAAAKARADVIKALSDFGVANAKLLDPAKWPEFVARMDAILAA